MTLAQIIEQEQTHRIEGGAFGIKACKESIEFTKKVLHKSYYTQLEEFMERANSDHFFNRQMILACWELINE